MQRLALALVGLFLVAACGGGDGDVAERAATHTDSDTMAAAADTAAAAEATEAPTLKTTGYVRNYPEPGFLVYWPSGCARIKERVSDGATQRAEHEFIYTCDRDGEKIRGTSVHALHGAHGPDGAPPDPPLVVSMVERQLQKFGVRRERQRMLQVENIEGVEVQAVEPDGTVEVWIRGLLMGDDVYLLTAWNREGGLFEDPETVNFFASFRAEQP